MKWDRRIASRARTYMGGRTHLNPIQSTGDRLGEWHAKFDRAQRLLSEHKCDGLLLQEEENIAWALCGVEPGLRGGTGKVALWVDAQGLTLLASNDDAARLDEEALLDLPAEIVTWPWYKDAEAEISRFVAGRAGLADSASAGLTGQPNTVSQLRVPLTDQEIERYRNLGRDAAVAVESVVSECRRGQSELHIAARLAERLYKVGATPSQIHVAADDRIDRYRQPPPTEAEVGYRIMVAASVRRFGLTVALTRLAQLSEISREMESRHQAAVEVEAWIMVATREGRTASDLFETLCDLYAEAGYPGEWEMHSQGGAIGYLDREWSALPRGTERVYDRQAFAWRATIAGTRSEDTMLLVDGSRELLTAGSAWPQRTVYVEGDSVGRPDILRL